MSTGHKAWSTKICLPEKAAFPTWQLSLTLGGPDTGRQALSLDDRVHQPPHFELAGPGMPLFYLEMADFTTPLKRYDAPRQTDLLSQSLPIMSVSTALSWARSVLNMSMWLD